MTVRIGINGFGRIGRTVFRAAAARGAELAGELEIVAVNDLGDVPTMAHLLAYDSVNGRLADPVVAEPGAIRVGDRSLAVLAERDPAQLPWGDLGVDVVLESTGVFTRGEQARAHVAAGARKVIIGAPATGEDATLVLGVNDHTYDPDRHTVVSNGSCTTNCLAVLAKVLHDAVGIESGLMTTVHAYTQDQNLHDAPHGDLRRARAAGLNIVPTSSGAARAIGRVLPELDGRLDAFALRVPVATGSVTDLTVTTTRPTTVEEVREAYAKAAAGPYKGLLSYTEAPIVSTDIVGDPASCVFDAELTRITGPQLKVVGWYDNEWGYSNRLLDLALMMGRAG
ncbi:type I glyceraldehyde-3-phosphate dehydrogenase [Yinghuangia seranimata]|uniref:type I glyceraldehyde-3-phosphate dehydrogenase n=1 Tax=Yinghuangia seranimata TaxID=408067 RepID=UPI00248CE61C|nr:type I glyceraldehyde-3-phosphate dehydrogenase [Yinghuangia seranimata]MDI2127747.1 type I glyceraldehyde-3-phosphate dehydrogenase [Yinghuangia seranimata]